MKMAHYMIDLLPLTWAGQSHTEDILSLPITKFVLHSLTTDQNYLIEMWPGVGVDFIVVQRESDAISKQDCLVCVGPDWSLVPALSV